MVEFTDLPNEQFLKKLITKDACKEGFDWVKEQGCSFRKFWDTCEVTEWRVWAVYYLGGPHIHDRDLEKRCGCKVFLSNNFEDDREAINRGLNSFVTWKEQS